MARYALKARERGTTGKGSSRKIRQGGEVPAVLYGEGRGNRLLSVSAKDLDTLFRTAGYGSHLLDLEVEGEGKSKPTLALIREIQRHPARSNLLHIDLQQVSAKKKIHLTVPVILTGEPEGVKTGGGVLELLTRELEIQCLPDKMPDSITVDVSGLDIGKSVHVSDVSIDGVTIMTPAGTAVATVVRPTVVVEAKPAEAEVVAEVAEGEEAEEGKPAAEGKPEESKGKESKGKEPKAKE
jgi:large subunit ribosomal protein L25